MERDPIRKKIHDLLWQCGLNMREASLAINRNSSYMHRFLKRGMPKVLSYRDALKLAELLGCEPTELQHTERPRRRRRFATDSTQETKEINGDRTDTHEISDIPEVEIEASAGPGALNGEFMDVKATWHLPDKMIRYEGGADYDCRAGDVHIDSIGESVEAITILTQGA